MLPSLGRRPSGIQFTHSIYLSIYGMGWDEMGKSAEREEGDRREGVEEVLDRKSRGVQCERVMEG